MTDIGLIGVGFIGKLFLDGFLEAGHAVTVFDVDDSQVAAATGRGATSASSPAEVAASADVVLMALPGPRRSRRRWKARTACSRALSEHLVADAAVP